MHSSPPHLRTWMCLTFAWTHTERFNGVFSWRTSVSQLPPWFHSSICPTAEPLGITDTGLYKSDVLPVHESSESKHLRAFSVVGPLVWSSLPDYVRDPAVSSDTFYKHLKTFLFAVYWHTFSTLLEVLRRCPIPINIRFTYLLTYLTRGAG